MLDETLRVVGVVLGLIATAFGIIKGWKEASAASGNAHLSSLQAAADEWREIKEDYQQRLEVMETRSREQDKELKEQAKEFSDQQEQINVLNASVSSLKATEGRLIGWVGRLHQGIDDGSIPPLPIIPFWLQDLLEDGEDKA